MRFLIDAQLPPALARWIEHQGYDAQHVFDIGLDSASDAVIWERAAAKKDVIVTKDEDFVQRRGMVLVGPPVVWLRIGNTSRGYLLTWIAPLFPKILAALQRGETLIEIR